jgi:CRP-like cAMP-binding protein
MHDFFYKYLTRFSAIPLTEKEMELIKNAFVVKKIRKRQYLLQEGEVCKYLGFITKGAMRQYRIDDKGAEHIMALSIENWWAGDRESFATGKPSVYNIAAWEDTDALLITKPELKNLLKQIPTMVEMKRRLGENHLIATQRRLDSLITSSAEKRLVDFEGIYPQFLQRFPQHIIASYLGVTKETLSRIRRQLVEK